jgi:exosortase
MIIGQKYRISVFQLLLCTIPLVWLWFVLINDLRIEWTVNAEYSYGWAVPFLCVYLLWQRIQRGGAGKKLPAFWIKRLGTNSLLFSTFAVLAVMYFPTRMIQEVNPDWRLVSWGLALEVVGITFCLMQAILNNAKSDFTIRDFAFPFLFFLVAVPWPTWVEQHLIQLFTRVDVMATTEVMGLFGIPAIPHGNVIEVATGVVGIDEACSGIRSFQATLMVSLFLGEWLPLRLKQRSLLVLSGFLFSLLFNFVRLVLLVAVASHKGLAALNRWHDRTGVTILLGCFFCLWFLAHWFAKNNPMPAAASAKPVVSRLPVTDMPFPTAAFLALAFWLFLAEITISSWFRYHEERMPAPVTWTVNWPANPTMKELPIAPEARQILRYDEGQNRTWQVDGRSWQGVFLRWEPGSIATRLTYNHTPEVCLTASGHPIAEQIGPVSVMAHGLEFSFVFYRLAGTREPMFVAYSLWEDRSMDHTFRTAMLGWGNRLEPVLAGQRSTGQRSIELVLTGVTDFDSTKEAVQQLMNDIISPGSK